MRPLATVVAIVGIIGCTTSAPSTWQKQGADEQAVTRDISECHNVARAEALQQKPFRAAGTATPFGMPSARQSDDLSRSTYEAERFQVCMQERGYSRR